MILWKQPLFQKSGRTGSMKNQSKMAVFTKIIGWQVARIYIYPLPLANPWIYDFRACQIAIFWIGKVVIFALPFGFTIGHFCHPADHCDLWGSRGFDSILTCWLSAHYSRGSWSASSASRFSKNLQKRVNQWFTRFFNFNMFHKIPHFSISLVSLWVSQKKLRKKKPGKWNVLE